MLAEFFMAYEKGHGDPSDSIKVMQELRMILSRMQFSGSEMTLTFREMEKWVIMAQSEKVKYSIDLFFSKYMSVMKVY